MHMNIYVGRNIVILVVHTARCHYCSVECAQLINNYCMSY